MDVHWCLMMFIDLYACWCDVPILILIFMDVHSLHFYRFSLIFIGFHECSLNFIDFHRCLLIFIYFHRCPCMFIDCYRFSLILLNCIDVDELSYSVIAFHWVSLFVFLIDCHCCLFIFIVVCYLCSWMFMILYWFCVIFIVLMHFHWFVLLFIDCDSFELIDIDYHVSFIDFHRCPSSFIYFQSC